MRGKICSSVRVGGAIAGACSIGALTSAIAGAQELISYGLYLGKGHLDHVMVK
ncbi:hypothetical protein Tco_0485945, partial [Tanacetum coccineum]